MLRIYLSPVVVPGDYFLLKNDKTAVPPYAHAQASFSGMSDQILTASRRERPGETTRDGGDSPRGHDSLLGLRGEVRFRVLDSSAGPGEPLCRCVFPFSFYVFRLLQGLQNGMQNGGQGGGPEAIAVSEEALRRKFGLLQLGGNVHATLLRAAGSGVHDASGAESESGCHQDDDFIGRYAHDFTCMLLPTVRRMSRADQAQHLLKLLDIAGPGCRDQEKQLRMSRQVTPSELNGGNDVGWTPVQSIAAVHHRFWREEDSVRLHFKLLDAAGPAAFARVATVMQTRLQHVRQGARAGGLDPHLHLLVARAVQLALVDGDALAKLSELPWTPSGPEPAGESPAAWASKVDGADCTTQNIIVSSVRHKKPRGDGGSCGDRSGDDLNRALEELLEGWARLRVMRKLIVDVAAPLPFALPPQAVLAAVKTLREEPHPVRSRGFLEAVVLALAGVAAQTQVSLSFASTTTLTGSLSFGGPHALAQPDLVWDLFPRFLEGYLSTTIFGAATGGVSVQIPDGAECAEEAILWETVVALLSGDASYFIERLGASLPATKHDGSDVLANIFPREAACVEGLRWLRARSGESTGTAGGDCLRAGLWREFERAGGSCDNKLAVCFAVAVEEATPLDQVCSCASLRAFRDTRKARHSRHVTVRCNRLVTLAIIRFKKSVGGGSWVSKLCRAACVVPRPPSCRYRSRSNMRTQRPRQLSTSTLCVCRPRVCTRVFCVRYFTGVDIHARCQQSSQPRRSQSRYRKSVGC